MPNEDDLGVVVLALMIEMIFDSLGSACGVECGVTLRLNIYISTFDIQYAKGKQ